MEQLLGKKKESVVRMFRSPTLETVKMVERIIDDFSGEFRKTALWERLPRKVMWSTYLEILNYLVEINKIVVSEDGVISYIWNPELVKRVRFRKSY